MDMRKEIITILVVTGALLIILGIGELIHRIFPLRPEFSRKSVHLLSGLIALSFPYLIHSHWFVLLLAGGFSSVVLVAKRKVSAASYRGRKRFSLPSLANNGSALSNAFLNKPKTICYISFSIRLSTLRSRRPYSFFPGQTYVARDTSSSVISNAPRLSASS